MSNAANSSPEARLGRMMRSILGNQEPFAWTNEDSELAAKVSLLPAIWPSVPEGRVYACPEDRAVLRTAYELNQVRNTQISAQILQIARQLNSIGVRPMFIKGTAHLVSDLWPMPGSRMLRDVDVLVAEDEVDHCHRHLSHWATNGPADMRDLNPKHKCLIHGPNLEAPIEVHRCAVPGPLGKSAQLLENGVPFSSGGAEFLLPSPEDSLRIAIVHGPLGHLDTRIFPKDTLDAAFLRDRHAIDLEPLFDLLLAEGQVIAAAVANRNARDFLGQQPWFDRVLLRDELRCRVRTAILDKPNHNHVLKTIWLGNWFWRQLTGEPYQRRRLFRALLDAEKWRDFAQFYSRRS